MCQICEYIQRTQHPCYMDIFQTIRNVWYNPGKPRAKEILALPVICAGDCAEGSPSLSRLLPELAQLHIISIFRPQRWGSVKL